MVPLLGNAAWALGETVDCPPGDYGSFYMARAGTFGGGTLPLPPTPSAGGWRRYVVASASCGSFVSPQTTGAHSNGVDTDGPKSGVTAGVLFVAAMTEAQLWEPDPFTGFTSDAAPPPSPTPSPEPSPEPSPSLVEPSPSPSPSPATSTATISPQDLVCEEQACVMRLDGTQYLVVMTGLALVVMLLIVQLVRAEAVPILRG